MVVTAALAAALGLKLPVSGDLLQELEQARGLGVRSALRFVALGEHLDVAAAAVVAVLPLELVHLALEGLTALGPLTLRRALPLRRERGCAAVAAAA
eukprot:CAMPEP_0202043772 /NCGR_PEP_ID=MMETSP0962-20130828/31371_1 /ASSEMBLY_ACC=CAM_ASM_000488 /TAXON_ID=4773 /ORGANISM="Schizochytrium aggregatum, Strain ATCC28209" /LENGTH=96 /DNA_ID=CAMNT_0048608273 /DNA_START=649 /DNA_END=935 /DNA_ORIENTATION=+